MQTSQFKHPYCCWICGKEVDLKTCSTDEHGMAVHEHCYFLKVVFATESMRLMVGKPEISICRSAVSGGALRKRRSL